MIRELDANALFRGEDGVVKDDRKHDETEGEVSEAGELGAPPFQKIQRKMQPGPEDEHGPYGRGARRVERVCSAAERAVECRQSAEDHDYLEEKAPGHLQRRRVDPYETGFDSPVEVRQSHHVRFDSTGRLPSSFSFHTRKVVPYQNITIT